jgi:hypothetical protein
MTRARSASVNPSAFGRSTIEPLAKPFRTITSDAAIVRDMTI